MRSARGLAECKTVINSYGITYFQVNNGKGGTQLGLMEILCLAGVKQGVSSDLG